MNDKILIPYWIQKADLSSEDFNGVDYKEAQAILKSINWRFEKQRQNDLENSNSQSCDPGIGFVPGDGRILHLCPDGQGNAYFHYHFRETKRFLGLFKYTSDRVISRMKIRESELSEVVFRFFMNDHEWLINKSIEAV